MIPSHTPAFRRPIGAVPLPLWGRVMPKKPRYKPVNAKPVLRLFELYGEPYQSPRDALEKGFNLKTKAVNKVMRDARINLELNVMFREVGNDKWVFAAVYDHDTGLWRTAQGDNAELESDEQGEWAIRLLLERLAQNGEAPKTLEVLECREPLCPIDAADCSRAVDGGRSNG